MNRSDASKLWRCSQLFLWGCLYHRQTDKKGRLSLEEKYARTGCRWLKCLLSPNRPRSMQLYCLWSLEAIQMCKRFNWTKKLIGASQHVFVLIELWKCHRRSAYSVCTSYYKPHGKFIGTSYKELEIQLVWFSWSKLPLNYLEQPAGEHCKLEKRHTRRV